MELMWAAVIIAVIGVFLQERRIKSLEARMHGMPETISRLKRSVDDLEEKVDNLEFELSLKD
ncbi:hypothetical protein [Serratia rubidaea]|uniref:Phage shock protein B n=1 Tax=Serratia rubidaea TaxID=61652 RepID=A0ABS0MEY0_SERRU|nr:hypothetical protein [Serratia rubidaea]MBH1930857.1 hypothetical protein [Serratia rubidaea]